MLSQLLSLLREEPDLSHANLCQRLQVSPETLQSMIDILIRKGKLKPEESPSCSGKTTCTQKVCPGPEECELVLIKPITEIRISSD
ncbi:MAG: FeoC-like transcriptional regulator [Anaerolineales bacterium]